MIRVFNLFWLVLVLGLVPWMASRSFGSWQVASRYWWQTLTVSAIGVGAALNALIWWSSRRRAVRRSSLRWCVAFLILGLMEVLFFAGVFHFRWLR